MVVEAAAGLAEPAGDKRTAALQSRFHYWRLCVWWVSAQYFQFHRGLVCPGEVARGNETETGLGSKTSAHS